MELKVWVEGIQRIVCGVSDLTTCQDVVYALAHATGKTGRFTLIERWRNSERLLAPHEHPLKILLKWGEYSSDVQFILQRTALDTKAEVRQLPPSQSQLIQRNGRGNSGTSCQPSSKASESQHTSNVQQPNLALPQSPTQHRDIKKSLTFSGGHAPLQPHLRDIVNTVPHGAEDSKLDDRLNDSPLPNSGGNLFKPNNQHSTVSKNVSNNVVDNGDLNDNRISPLSSTSTTISNNNAKPELIVQNNLNHFGELTIENNEGTLNNNNQSIGTVKTLSKSSKENSPNISNMLKSLIEKKPVSSMEVFHKGVEEVVVDDFYQDLVNLVNSQRDKISAQQIDITKHEAEVAYLEGRHREEESRLTFIQSEIEKLEKRIADDEGEKLRLEATEKEWHDAQRIEVEAREKLANTEKSLKDTELLIEKASKKMRSLQEALENAKEASENEADKRENDALLREIDRLQRAIQQADLQAKQANEMEEKVEIEQQQLEKSLVEKLQESEMLKKAMKEANIEALAMTPPDEDKAEDGKGAAKFGSSRRMLGSPRQLETAVPTSKNPHGVWV